MATILRPQDKNNQGSNVPQVGANAPAQASPQATPQKKGSGQFTNIQSYLNANKGAGQRLAQGVASQVQKTLDPTKAQTQQYNEQVRQGIQSAQNTLQQGQGQLGQLKQIGSNIQANIGDQFYGTDNDLGIESFQNDPNYNQFQRIQQGQGVNEDQLNLQQQAFANQAAKYNQLAKEQSGLSGTEGGRFDLLKRSFGGNVNPKYTSGQQRLDQLFLARQGLGGLKQDLQQNINQSKALQAQTQETGKGARLAQEQEKTLINDIDTQNKANESDYLKMLESYIPEVNRRREQEFSDLSSRYGNMSTKNLQAGGLLDKQVVGKNGLEKATTAPEVAPQGLTSNDLKLLGLTQNRQMFDVFDKTNLEDVAERGKSASGYRDVASQRNVDLYNKLADIGKIDSGSRKLTQAGDLGNAVLAKSGAANLEERLKAAADEFNRYAQSTDYREHIGGGKKWAQSESNLRDILAGKDIVQADRGMGAQNQIQAQNIYNRALQDLRNKGYGKVLSTEGDVNDILAGVAPQAHSTSANTLNGNIINEIKRNQGIDKTGGYTNVNAGQLRRTQGGKLRTSGSNLDEDILAALKKYGIKGE